MNSASQPKRNRFPRWTALLVLGLALLSACKQKQYLRGHYQFDEFCQQATWDRFVDERYKPKAMWMDSIRALQVEEQPNVRIFLGTYCHDSQKWVPRFFSLRDELPIGNVEIVSVDTTKRDDMGWAKEAGITKIPTFIFLTNGREIGRITEKPKGRLEENIYLILKNL